VHESGSPNCKVALAGTWREDRTRRNQRAVITLPRMGGVLLLPRPPSMPTHIWSGLIMTWWVGSCGCVDLKWFSACCAVFPGRYFATSIKLLNPFSCSAHSKRISSSEHHVKFASVDAISLALRVDRQRRGGKSGFKARIRSLPNFVLI